MDETRPRALFDPYAEELRYFEVARAEIETARREYTFLADRLPDYGKLPMG
jgi:hypothetical protein